MQAIPYSIYIDKRPLRIAFLVNPNKHALEEIEAIVDYNQYKWGGRYNPVIFTDGKNIEEKWWKFLCDVDPDIIKSLVPIEDGLIKKIYLFLSPISLEVPKKQKEDFNNYSIYIDFEGLSILPTIENINKLGLKLVLFDLTDSKETIINQFIKLNFGTYSINYQSILELDENNKKVFKITDKESFSAALKELSVYQHFVYPIQICSIPNTFKEIENSGVEIPFTVIIGDSHEDIVYNWNRSLSTPNWQKNSFNQIWLPTKIAYDTDLENALKEWLKIVYWDSGRSNHRVKFVSFSLTKDELKKIAERLTKNTLSQIVDTFREIQTPQFLPDEDYLRIKKDMDSFQVTGDNVQLTLDEPNVQKGVIGGEQWVAEIYIQFHPERYPSLSGWNLKWRLPQNNQLAFDMFHHMPSRICSNGFPAVLMSREYSKLNIRLPSDTSIFQTLIIKKNAPLSKSDSRSKFASSPFIDAQPSDKGKYLSGFLDIFKDLAYAYQILECKYWRHMFNILSKQNPKKDESKRENILNRLKRKEINSITKNEGLEWLADYILTLSKNVASIGKELLFKDFEKEAEKELEKFNSLSQENKELGYKKKHIIDDLKKTLSTFIELGIIHIGIRPHCPRCGYGQWFHIDEVKQNLICKDCRTEFTIKPQEDWFYKLNSLIQVGCSQHGLIPVVLVLGQLLLESRSSFIMDTTLDIFKVREEEPFTDLDIVCIKDGKFIIGEIKQSNRGFTNKDFEKIAEVAEGIKPDILLFSSLEPNCNRKIKEKIENLRKRLEPLKVEVKWYQLHADIFEPSPFL